ncbi:ATP-binding cassette domain-containing protein, partial [Paracidovorax cattleyae]
GRSLLAARRLAPRLAKPAAEPRSPRIRHDTPGGETPAACLAGAEAGSTAAGEPLLRGIDLRLAHGERVAVVGASGAGKTTLLSLVAGELPARAGTVQAEACTWLTQRTELFQDSIRDNLRLAGPAATDDRLWAVLEASGLAADVERIEHGLDTRLGEGGLGLSGGQSRRLALARLLLHRSGFWLLDEPTEGMDGPTACDVLARLERHAAHKTLLIATHLRREARLADRLVVMARGRIVAQHLRGTPSFDAALQALRAH